MASDRNYLTLCGLILNIITMVTTQREGDLKLQRLNGFTQEEVGNVLIYHQGRWGSICDDGWMLNNAQVVCRSLGYPSAIGHTKQAYFGIPEEEFWLDNVQCYGDEASITDCFNTGWGAHDCALREASGVFCMPKRENSGDSGNSGQVDSGRAAPSSTLAPSVYHVETTTVAKTTTTTRRPGRRQRPRNRGNARGRESNRRRPQNINIVPISGERNRDEEDLSRYGHTTRPRTRPSYNINNTPSPQPTRSHHEVSSTERPIEPSMRNSGNSRGGGGAYEAERTQDEVVRLEHAHRDRGSEHHHHHHEEPIEELPPMPSVEEMSDIDILQNDAVVDAILTMEDKLAADKMAEETKYDVHKPPEYKIDLKGGRTPKEGYLQITLEGKKGAICSDGWDLREASVVCRQLGLNYAGGAVAFSAFGGETEDKLIAGIECDGHESKLSDCFHKQIGKVMCPRRMDIAGVICADLLPDLVPNATLLQHSAYLQDRPMYYIQCAMEEGCASSSAYEIKNANKNWFHISRRLLRFSSSTWNFGTADFRPFLRKEDWEWHQCHMHYHSMEVFAQYDLLDKHGNRVAEGHKASFCLEDVQCLPGREKRYACTGFGDQGISVGCADDYLHDIDCQWIDVSDVPPGEYIFQVHINPGYRVAELNFDNNVAQCDLAFTGASVDVRNCVIINDGCT